MAQVTVTVEKSLPETKLGLTIKRSLATGVTRVGPIVEGGLFAETDLKEGMTMVSINDTEVNGMELDGILDLLKKSERSITIVAEMQEEKAAAPPAPAPKNIVASVDRSTSPDSLLGLTIRRMRSTGESRIFRIHEDGLFANTALKEGMKVVSINDIDVANMELSDVLTLLKNARTSVTVVAEMDGKSASLGPAALVLPKEKKATDTISRFETRPSMAHMHLNDRLMANDPSLVRLDITASVLTDFTSWEKEDFIYVLQSNTSVRHVHLSGDGLDKVMTANQIDMLIDALGYMQNLEELFVFKGNSKEVSGVRLGKALKMATKVKVFMIWGFAYVQSEHELAGAIRNHLNLERVTITLPGQMKYACLDVFVMGFAGMLKLKCLCVRCKGRQTEAIVSPEAISLLMGSRSLDSIYFENCGLTDEHTDAIAEELPHNHKLTLLDLKHNLFTDDPLYTFAAALKQNRTLKSLDISGCTISESGVYALASTLKENTVITHVELEGEESRFRDEFHIPEGHTNTPYMQALYFQLRLNRAGKRENIEQFAEALNMVSDHLGCIYHLVRHHPKYFDRETLTGASKH